jgi:hypothetical protein
MKTQCIRISRLIPLVGIALVAAAVLAGATYWDIERQTRAGEALTVTLDRIYHDQQICSALKAMHEGDAILAAQRLDLMLCDDILALDAQLASADQKTRNYIKFGFGWLALNRPKNAHTAAASGQELLDDQIQAEKILARASAALVVGSDQVVTLR